MEAATILSNDVGVLDPHNLHSFFGNNLMNNTMEIYV